MCLRMSCVNGCVVALDWYLSRTFFRSDVSGAGVLMHALCLFDGRSVVQVLLGVTRGRVPVMGRLVYFAHDARSSEPKTQTVFLTKLG